jgi:hypothetical protein
VGLVTKGSVIRRVVEAMYSYRPDEALLDIHCPLTVMVADAPTADDERQRERLLALDDMLGARSAAGLPAMRVRRFGGAGHDLARHRPLEVVEELMRLCG